METNERENNDLKTLIDKAGKLVGNERKLSIALGIPQTHISMWKSGKKACTPPDRARLAAMANEDAVQELVRATLTATAGTLRGEQLQSVLGKWLRATGGAASGVLLSLHNLDCGTVWSAASVDLLRRIKSKHLRFQRC